jgi:hypothetical protein
MPVTWARIWAQGWTLVSSGAGCRGIALERRRCWSFWIFISGFDLVGEPQTLIASVYSKIVAAVEDDFRAGGHVPKNAGLGLRLPVNQLKQYRAIM